MVASLTPQQRQILQMQQQAMAMSKMPGMGMGMTNMFGPKKDEEKK
jgi:hypothetical protein